jgi:hypothetical protein
MQRGNDSLALKELNERNILFWHARSELTLKHLSDESVFSLAQKDMDSQATRGVPLRSRKSLEQVLADFADAKHAFQADFSRKGGKARKCDALNDLIEGIAKRRPAITAGQLLLKLAGDSGAGVVTRVESPADVRADEGRQIHYVDDDGRPKTASVSGLKWRLARAKARNKNALAG